MTAVELAAAPVQALSPYVPGKPISELEREYGITHSIKLASNENPLGPAPQALAAITQALPTLGQYPDGSGFDLKTALARRLACAPECITLGNGSNELLMLLAETFLTPAVEAVYAQYCFAIYPLVVQATGAVARVAPAFPAEHAQAFGHDLDALAKQVNERTRLIFIANPNNPTGTWVNRQALKAFIASVPTSCYVVVDEAYFEYVQDEHYPDTSQWLSVFPNLIVTRTFSKAFGLAGLRVGYALSSVEVAEVLNRVRQPFNVNTLGLVAATAALHDAAHLQRTVQLNTEGMQQVVAGVSRLGLSFCPSAGNFVLVDCARPAALVYQAMLRAGVIVRPVTAYGLATHLRITIGTQDENARMLDVLASALRQV